MISGGCLCAQQALGLSYFHFLCFGAYFLLLYVGLNSSVSVSGLLNVQCVCFDAVCQGAQLCIESTRGRNTASLALVIRGHFVLLLHRAPSILQARKVEYVDPQKAEYEKFQAAILQANIVSFFFFLPFELQCLRLVFALVVPNQK